MTTTLKIEFVFFDSSDPDTSYTSKLDDDSLPCEHQSSRILHPIIWKKQGKTSSIQWHDNRDKEPPLFRQSQVQMAQTAEKRHGFFANNGCTAARYFCHIMLHREIASGAPKGIPSCLNKQYWLDNLFSGVCSFGDMALFGKKKWQQRRLCSLIRSLRKERRWTRRHIVSFGW